jgi:hypothetical protein
MGNATAGREELLRLYLINVSERKGKYNSIKSDWMGLKVFTYSFN